MLQPFDDGTLYTFNPTHAAHISHRLASHGLYPHILLRAQPTLRATLGHKLAYHPALQSDCKALSTSQWTLTWHRNTKHITSLSLTSLDVFTCDGLDGTVRLFPGVILGLNPAACLVAQEVAPPELARLMTAASSCASHAFYHRCSSQCSVPWCRCVRAAITRT